MYIGKQSFVAWKVILTFLHIFTTLFTGFRLWDRARRSRLWIDDYTLTPALGMNLLNIIIMWFLYVPAPEESKLQNRVALYWLSAIPWYTIIWSCRVSLAMTVSRILPAWGTPRRYARGLSVSFCTLYIGIMCWLFTTSCTESDDQKDADGFLGCHLEQSSLSITSLVADLAAAVILFFTPIAILCFIPIERGQHLLMLAFLACSSSTLVSVVIYAIFAHAPSIHGPGKPLVIGMLAQLEIIISISTCNVPALITYLRRYDRHPECVTDRIQWKKAPQQKAESPNATIMIIGDVELRGKALPDDWEPEKTFSTKDIRFSDNA